MTVDLTPQGNGRWHFSLGSVERWIVGVVAAAAVYCGYWVVSSMQAVLTQQAVTNERLISIDNRLTGVPQLQQQVTKLEVRVDRLETDTKELRQTRGLK